MMTPFLQVNPQSRLSTSTFRSLPLFQLFSLILYKDLETLDFSQNTLWVESDEMQVRWKLSHWDKPVFTPF
jgi:hypothetical protein